VIEIPNYKIGKELGSGGMSTVYLATHEILDRQVALKIMSPSFVRDGSFKDCFINEGRMISKLNHPHVIHIYDIGISNDACYMAIELLEGDTLRQKIDSNTLSIDQKDKIIIQIASALNAAHSQNFIHRDIKPGNILFRKNGDAVLTDFGISKVQDTESELTSLGLAAGTPSYMPPEFSMGEELDHRTDIYSLGVVFYEMLTGEKPYKANTAAAMSYEHVHSPIPQLEPSLAHYQNIINLALAKKPEERFNLVMDFANEVEKSAISHAPTIIVKRDSSGNKVPLASVNPSTIVSNLTDFAEYKNKKKKTKLQIATVIISLALIGIAGFFLLSPKEELNEIKNASDRSIVPIIDSVVDPVKHTNIEPSKVIHVVEDQNSIKTSVNEQPKPLLELDTLKPETQQDITFKPVAIRPTEPVASIDLLGPTVTVDPIAEPGSNLTDEQKIIVGSLLDNSLLRASISVKEYIRIAKSETIIEDIKGLKVSSGRTKFITDTRQQIATSKQRIASNIDMYYSNLTKLRSYKIKSVVELLNSKEEASLEKVTTQGIYKIMNTHLKKLVEDNLTVPECREDFSNYAEIVSSTL